ncbi:MAG: 6-phosphogluconolactonase [Candidatus Bipolaricaulia bacterium]
MKTFTFPESGLLYDHAAKAIERLAAEAVRERRRLLVALSGGSTPIPLYERLTRSKAIDWEHVHVFWSDERCVPPDDPASNFAAARRALLDSVPIPAEQIHRIEGERPPIEAADAYEILVRRTLGEEGRLDLVLLGMGTDGHTASLFPRHQALSETERWILPVHVSAEPAWRITMTLPLINAARHVQFLVVGREKANALSRIERGEDPPASRVTPAEGRLTWLVSTES